MPEKDADVLKVLIGQVAERLGSNAVFGKTLDVLGHAEFFEPARNLLRRGAAVLGSFRHNVSL
jgi:hypothetical protein